MGDYYSFTFSSMYFIVKGVWTANDPVAVYPLKGKVTTRDASTCNNSDAELLDESGNKMSDVNLKEHVLLRPGGIRTIRITNNDGNLKVKSLTILIRIRPRASGSRAIVAFSAQGKSVLLFSLQENEIRFSLNSSDGEYLSANMMLDSKGKVQERDWYSLAVTYSHTTGNVSLHSSESKSYRGFLGTLEVEEPEYVYLGNNMESEKGGSNEQHSLEPFNGKLECFMLYRRTLKFSETLQAMNLCQTLPNDKGNDDDYDNDNDNDDESGGKISYLIFLFVPSFG